MRYIFKQRLTGVDGHTTTMEYGVEIEVLFVRPNVRLGAGLHSDFM